MSVVVVADSGLWIVTCAGIVVLKLVVGRDGVFEAMALASRRLEDYLLCPKSLTLAANILCPWLWRSSPWP